MMVRLLIALATFASLPLGYAQCPAMGSASAVSPVLKVDLRGKEAAVKAGSPLWIEVSTTNPSDHEISFWKSTNANYAIEVADDSGRPLPDKRPGYRHGRFDPTLLDPKNLDPKLVDSGEIVKMLSGSLVCVTMKPGENSVDRIDVTKFYDMSAPGSYTIAVEGMGPAKTGTVKSSPVKVLVTKE